MQKILLVDDDENILNGYKRNLRTYFNINTSTSPKTALQLLKENEDTVVIVSDFSMPEMNGIRFLTKVKEILPDSVRMLLTGNADLSMAIKAVNEGNIFRFLTKPCDQETLRGSIMQGIEQYKLITAEKELLGSTLRGSLKIMIDILAMVNATNFSKSILIRNMAKKLLSRIRMPENWEIDIACLLSQIGCVGISSEIIEKRHSGAKLTQLEEDTFMSQAKIGNDLLKNIPRLENVAVAISMQYKPLGEVCIYKNYGTDSAVKDRIIFIACLLKILNDYFHFLETEGGESKALELLRKNKSDYSEILLNALEAELLEDAKETK